MTDSTGYEPMPTVEDEQRVHLAVIARELWSPACCPAWKWDVPLARHPQQVTCLRCRALAVPGDC